MGEAREVKYDIIGWDATPSPVGLEATDCEEIVPDHDISMTETRLL
jgi:hypothetical protein